MFGTLGQKKYRKRKQKGIEFTIGLLVPAAAPILGKAAKPIIKKFWW